MKYFFHITLSFCILFLFSILKADQITITFDNDFPNVPYDCGVGWLEQSLPMTIYEYDPPDEPIIDGCNFSYGNGNLSISEGFFSLNLSSLVMINKVTVSFSGNNINFQYTGNTIINENSTFSIHEFINDDLVKIDRLNIVGALFSTFTLYDITIEYTPICEAEPISNVRNGDVYLNDACYGVIMTSPSGNCFRAKVADNGSLFTEPVECP